MAIQLNHVTDTISASSANGVNILSRLVVSGAANVTGDILVSSNLVVGNSGVLAPLTVVARPANTNVALRIVSDTTSTRFAEIRKADSVTTFYSGVSEDLYLTSTRRNFYTSVGGGWASSFAFTTSTPQTYAADGQGTACFYVTSSWSPVTGNGYYRHVELTPTISQAANTIGDYTVLHAYAQETATYGANNRLIDMGTGGTRRFAVSNTGSIFSAGSANIVGDLIVSGNVTLGDASTDTITLRGSTISLGNNQSIDAGTLFIDATNNRVGIGNTVPLYSLQVSGTGYFMGTAKGEATSESSFRLKFDDVGGTNNDAGIGVDAGSNVWFNVVAGAGFRFLEGTAGDRMVIATGGNVGIGTTAPAYKLQVAGSFAAQTKSFVINHPSKPDMKLRYGSLEGPENGVYVRGRTKELVIRLPDYWTGLVDESSITVNITPVGHHQHLYVRKIQDNLVYVSSDSETFREIDYFYTVYAERKDVEKLVVEF